MLFWISIFGGLLIMMGQHARTEVLFYYFRLEDLIPESHLLQRLQSNSRVQELRSFMGRALHIA
jgi:hypothetical protein